MTEGLRIYDLPATLELPAELPARRRGRSSGVGSSAVDLGAEWSDTLAHAAAMAFNAVGLSGAAVADLPAENRRAGNRADNGRERVLRELAAAGADLGLRIVLDLRVEDGAAPAQSGPRLGEAARRAAAAGVGGFRCRGVDRAPPDFWHDLVAETKSVASGVLFCAETPGLPEEAILALADCGFDYLFNNARWWDFRNPWLIEQYQRYRHIAPSIGFPEDGGERLVGELLGAGFGEDQLEARYRQAYAFAAAFSTGVLMPMGFEYGWSRPVAGGNGDAAGATPALPNEAEPARFDLASFVAATNRLKAAVPALNQEGRQLWLTPPGDPLVALLRESEHSGERALTLVNTHDAQSREVDVKALLATAELGYLGDRLAWCEMLSGGEQRPGPRHLDVAPFEVKVLRATLPPVRRLEIAARPTAQRQPRHHAAWDAEARILIENVRPEIDGGRFPAKRIVGEAIAVAADLLRDGHDRIAAVLRYAHEDEAENEAWQEAPLGLVENDRWQGVFRPDRVGVWHYTIEAWTDRFASWCDDFAKKRDAGQDVGLELVEGEWLVRGALHHAQSEDAAAMRALLDGAAGADNERRGNLLLSPELRRLMARNDDRRDRVRYARTLDMVVDRPEARFSAWYEMFPRSQGRIPGKSATFDDCIDRLSDVAALGFDVVYLVPIHPIGRENRKGRDNAVVAMPSDPGSPYAIGGPEGGHRAVHPELGTLDDFRRFVAAAAELGIEVALDFAIQCAPDHPWVKEHKRWFEYRPDGSIKHAENPPKKYEDIVNVDFYNPDREGLWTELRDTVLFWVDQGVRIFRVDNPHTKPLPFWEWLIREVKARDPGTVFLSEAFTRPKMMRALAKLGFSQSYTYFTWRDSKSELTEYLTELTQGEGSDYFRPNFFTNTPDILPVFLQQGGRPAFRIRLVLAATLSPSYGIYNGFELCENTAIPDREEYLHSEKYEYKVWDWDRPGNIKRDIAILNRFRRDNPALQELANLRFLDCPDPNILAYAKVSESGDNIVVVAVNLDPFGLHAGDIVLPLGEWGIAYDREFSVEEAFSGHIYSWRGDRHFVSLDPHHNPALLLHLLPVDR
ncbi:MAG: maltotransferase domain-containing protein [Thiohalocapsa sp.]